MTPTPVEGQQPEAIDSNLASIYYAGRSTVNFISKKIVGMDIHARRKFLAEVHMWLDERIQDLDRTLNEASPIVTPDAAPLIVVP